MSRKSKIFVVEDDKFYADLLQNEITKEKLGSVELFTSGELFLDNIYKRPDIVILDHHLGSMEGIDVLKKIKAVNPNIQVILLSAQEQLNVAITSLKYGAFDYIEKNARAFSKINMLIKKINDHNKLIRERNYNRIVRIMAWVLAVSLLLIMAFLSA